MYLCVLVHSAAATAVTVAGAAIVFIQVPAVLDGSNSGLVRETAIANIFEVQNPGNPVSCNPLKAKVLLIHMQDNQVRA